MIVKLFTMVKDEIDIVEEWIQYHGTIFGFHNLHIVDNNSTDGTLDILKKYTSNGVKLFHEPDYRRKGIVMTQLINDPRCGKYDIAYPIDIDEFIVYYDKQSNTIDPNRVYSYMKTLLTDKNLLLQKDNIFKANFITSMISNNSATGYNKAVIEAQWGEYCDMKTMAKSFFNKHTWKGLVDHGNHCNTETYILTDLCLVHYHSRNLEQHRRKVINNLKGLGYDYLNLSVLKKVPPKSPGIHHVRHMIRILENTYNINIDYQHKSSDIDLRPLSGFISKLPRL
jgi:hypothetical protein